MHRRRIASALLGVLGIFALASVAHATTLLKLTMDDLVDRSARIVHGEVSTIEPRKENGRIVTYITLDVRETLKGPADQTQVSFRVLGGRMGDLVTIVHGTPQFSVGEETLVFLEQPSTKKGPTPPLVVTGMTQGKFRITKGPDQKTLYVVPSLGETNLVERVEVRDDEGKLRKRLQSADPSAEHSSVQSYDVVKAHILARVKGSGEVRVGDGVDANTDAELDINRGPKTTEATK